MTRIEATDEVDAFRWWCGDEVCDCTQYVIEQVHEERIPGLPGRTRFRRRRLWEGEFRCDSSYLERSDRAGLLRDYRHAARRFGVKLRLDAPFTQRIGERPATPDEIADMAAGLVG